MDFQGKNRKEKFISVNALHSNYPRHQDHERKIELVGISSTILSEHNGPELAVNSDFMILDTLRKLVDTSCRRVKVSHRCRGKPNSHTVKYQNSYKKVVVSLPGLELLRPPSSRDQTNKLDKSENSNQKSDCFTENTKRPYRPIYFGQLDSNSLSLKKSYSAKLIFTSNISLPCPDPPVGECHSIFPGPLDFDMPISFVLNLWETLRQEGLIGRTEFTELSSLPELPLDLDMPPTFLDQVGGFVASRTRRPLILGDP